MSKGKFKGLYFIHHVILDLIEEEAGRSIEDIPKNELIRITEGLTTLNARLKGIKCSYGAFRRARNRLVQLISEGRIIDHVSKIRNSKKPKTRGYQPSIEFKNRNDYDIRADILTKSEDWAGKTYIMYTASLSPSEVNRYLDNLIRLGLLERKIEGGKKKFKTTDLGHHYLYVFKQLKKFFSGKATDKPFKLDKKSRAIAISAINKIRRKNFYISCAFILEKTFEPKYKTPLMHVSSKSWKEINRYIEFLTELGLLEKVEKYKYKTTPRGSQYLEEYLNFALFNYLG